MKNDLLRSPEIRLRSALPAALAALLCAALLAPAAARAGEAAPPWWLDDVWRDPDRPFLYYGDPREEEPEPSREAQSTPPAEAAPDLPRPLETLTRMEDVRREYAARLDRAVMRPTEENLAALHEVNTFVLGKSHQFAQVYDRVRIARPEFDWTAAHPSANFAAVELSSRAEADAQGFMKTLARESGLVFIGGADAALNGLALGPVRTFARAHGFELLVVATDAPVPGDDAKPDNGIARKLLALQPGRVPLPAVFLVPKPGTRHPALAALAGRPVPAAAGPVSVSELTERLMRLFAPLIEPGNAAPLPTRRGAEMAEGSAWSVARPTPLTTHTTPRNP